MVKKIALSVLVAGLVGSQAFASFDTLTNVVNVRNATTLSAVVGTTYAFNNFFNKPKDWISFPSGYLTSGALVIERTHGVNVLGFCVKATVPEQGKALSRVLNTEVSADGFTVKRTLAAAVAYGVLTYGLPFVHQAIESVLPK